MEQHATTARSFVKGEESQACDSIEFGGYEKAGELLSQEVLWPDVDVMQTSND